MKILLDTNIILDILLARKPFVDKAKDIFLLIENDKVEGFICATTITTIHYLIGRHTNKANADRLILEILKLFEVTLVDKNILEKATINNGIDYEDSVIYTSAQEAKIDIIITRDKKGFKNAQISVLNPQEFLAFWQSSF